MTSSERLEWLKARQTGIGGSDVAAILGLNRYKSPPRRIQRQDRRCVQRRRKSGGLLGNSTRRHRCKRVPEAHRQEGAESQSAAFDA